MPTISNHRLQRLEQAKRELTEIRDAERAREFSIELLSLIGIQLAIIPFDSWPDAAKTAFEYARRSLPVQAEVYRSRLPKEPLFHR